MSAIALREGERTTNTNEVLGDRTLSVQSPSALQQENHRTDAEPK